MGAMNLCCACNLETEQGNELDYKKECEFPIRKKKIINTFLCDNIKESQLSPTNKIILNTEQSVVEMEEKKNK